MQEWQSVRSMNATRPCSLMAVVVKVRDGQVSNRRSTRRSGDAGGRRTCSGSGRSGREGAKFLQVMQDLRNRGMRTCSSWSAMG